jgi:hypothetical protein
MLLLKFGKAKLRYMNSSGNSVTACRLCQHYNPEGRRGGFCGKLDVPVSPAWDACSLAAHPFESSWQPVDDFNALLNEFHDSISITHDQIPELQEANMRSLSFVEY